MSPDSGPGAPVCAPKDSHFRPLRNGYFEGVPARPNKIALFAVRALLLLCLPLFAAQERSVATEHFRFHYPVELRPYAERAAQIAEAVYDTLSRRYGIPLRTVQDWAGERRTPPLWLRLMLADLAGWLDRDP